MASTEQTSDEVYKEMRDWLYDCGADPITLSANSNAAILVEVERLFEGGVTAFLDTMGLEVIL